MPAQELEAELWSVGALFDDGTTAYEVPIYQRNYAWGTEEIEQLIDDVWQAAQSDNSYFLGNLIVARSRRDHEGTRVTYELIDGQQRLTTLHLLLQQLGVPPVARLTYQSRRSAADALAGLRTNQQSANGAISAGFKIIEARLAHFDASEVAGFSEYLRANVRLVRAVLPDRTDLNRYFEIMNTRGQQLQQVDIVKARLMSYLREVDNEGLERTRACFAWIWDACAQLDSYIQMALTVGDTGLRTQIFGPSWDRLPLRSFESLKSKLPDSTAHDQSGSASLGLQQALDRYARRVDPRSQDDLGGRFESPIKFPLLLLHALKVMRQDKDDDLDDTSGRLDDSKLITLFHLEFDKLPDRERSDRTKRFVEELLRCRFILDNFVIKREYTQTTGNEGTWSLKRLVRSTSRERGAAYLNSFATEAIESDDPPRDDWTRQLILLQSMLRVTYTSPRTMHWITAALRLHVINQAPADAAAMIQATLQKYARRKVQSAFFDGPEPQGFAVERVVFTYLDYLLARSDGTDFTFTYRNSIEHFFPQYADRELAGWERVGPDDPELNVLGNLALISVGANSKFSNNLPELKIKFSTTIAQSKKLQLMAATVTAGTPWDKDAIRAHHAAMVDLLRADLQIRDERRR